MNQNGDGLGWPLMDPLGKILASILFRMYRLISPAPYTHRDTNTVAEFFPYHIPCDRHPPFSLKRQTEGSEAAKAPDDGIAASQRAGQQPRRDGNLDLYNSTMGTNRPLSSITQKSRSRRKIVLPATGLYATTEEPGMVSQGGLTSGRGNLFSFCFLEPSFKAAVQARCQAHPYARSPSPHLSSITAPRPCFAKAPIHPEPGAQETPNKNNNDKTIIIALCRNSTFTHDFI